EAVSGDDADVLVCGRPCEQGRHRNGAEGHAALVGEVRRYRHRGGCGPREEARRRVDRRASARRDGEGRFGQCGARKCAEQYASKPEPMTSTHSLPLTLISLISNSFVVWQRTHDIATRFFVALEHERAATLRFLEQSVERAKAVVRLGEPGLAPLERRLAHRAPDF